MFSLSTRGPLDHGMHSHKYPRAGPERQDRGRSYTGQRGDKPSEAGPALGLKFKQINMNHCWQAYNLLTQTVIEKGVDVVIASDPQDISYESGGWLLSAGLVVLLFESSANGLPSPTLSAMMSLSLPDWMPEWRW